MKPPVFDYRRAESFEEACLLLAEEPNDSKIIAGGQTLIPMLNFRLARPKILVDISRIPDRDLITEEANGIRIRATTVQRAVERSSLVRARFPLLHRAVEHIAHLQIRNKGTIGGSIANADPASELPAMTMVFEAQLDVQSARGQRTLSAEEFFVSYYMTALEPDEILTSVYFPAPPKGTGWGFHELARRAGDFALAGSTALITLDESGVCTRARVTMFGVAPTPARAKEAEDMLVGQRYSEALVEHAAKAAQGVADPESDVHASAEYRRTVAEVMAARAIRDAFKQKISR
jgi:CO/xanthine dehydrogenase FAD-binding subunit